MLVLGGFSVSYLIGGERIVADRCHHLLKGLVHTPLFLEDLAHAEG